MSHSASQPSLLLLLLLLLEAVRGEKDDCVAAVIEARAETISNTYG
jgi:hypothetical protein